MNRIISNANATFIDMPWVNILDTLSLFPFATEEDIKGDMEKEKPKRNTKKIMNTLVAKEADATAFSPNPAIIIISIKFTDTWPSCVITTGIANLVFALICPFKFIKFIEACKNSKFCKPN